MNIHVCYRYKVRGCFGIPVFADALLPLARRYSVDNVFVATDNPEAAKLLQQLLPNLRVYLVLIMTLLTYMQTYIALHVSSSSYDMYPPPHMTCLVLIMTLLTYMQTYIALPEHTYI